jgi:hypothetical protein
LEEENQDYKGGIDSIMTVKNATPLRTSTEEKEARLIYFAISCATTTMMSIPLLFQVLSGTHVLVEVYNGEEFYESYE